MIKITLNSEGSTYITKGTCRLYIHHNSPRMEYSCYRELMDMGIFDVNRVGDSCATFSESRRMASMFSILKTDIYYGNMVEDQRRGYCDSVNVITLGTVAMAQDIMRGSVLA